MLYGGASAGDGEEVVGDEPVETSVRVLEGFQHLFAEGRLGRFQRGHQIRRKEVLYAVENRKSDNVLKNG